MSDYGILVTPNVQLQRGYFEEMCKLLGVNVLYRTPKAKEYTLHGELPNQFSEPEKVSCIFQQNIDQKTAKKLGWNAELLTEAAIIHVPYDLHDLQIGCLFDIPSALDGAPSRKFVVTELSTVMIYPASISCKLVPWYETTLPLSETERFDNSNFNLLWEGN